MEIFLIEETDLTDYCSTRIIKAFKSYGDAAIHVNTVESGEDNHNYSYEIIPITLTGAYDE
jgi:hypothetical protein